MNTNLKLAIIQTLKYSDIFDYPLTEKEIFKYLITPIPVSWQYFKDELDGVKLENIEYRRPFYCLKNRQKIISVRKNRFSISQNKLNSAIGVIKIIAKIPTIKFIGLSGSLARENADFNADVDLFIITARNRLWISRLLSLIILQFLKRRRKRSVKYAPDSICLNFFMDEANLDFSKNHQDLYTAYELIQLKPLFDRANFYRKLLFSNIWYAKYLANYNPHLEFNMNGRGDIINSVLCYIIAIFEYPSRWIQFMLINRHKTTEIVNAHMAAFHPKDYRIRVINQYNIREKNVKNI